MRKANKELVRYLSFSPIKLLKGVQLFEFFLIVALLQVLTNSIPHCTVVSIMNFLMNKCMCNVNVWNQIKHSKAASHFYMHTSSFLHIPVSHPLLKYTTRINIYF